METMKNIFRTVLFLFVVFSAFSGGQKQAETPKEVSGSFDANHNWQGDVVEIHIQGIEAGATLVPTAETAVARALTKKTGVKIIWEQASSEKWALQMSSGDLPDVVRFAAADTVTSSALIKGGHIVPLDAQIDKWGPNLKANLEKQLAISKAVHGGEHIYIIPMNTGVSGNDFPCIRWDWYRELGYPEIHNLDEYLQVLKRMVDAHPTEGGKKVYGVSSFINWGNSVPFFSPYGIFLGYGGVTNLGLTDFESKEIVSQLEDDPRSVFWAVVKFLYNANQLGIFDPDSFTQTWEIEVEKYHAGQLCATMGMWDRGGYYTQDHAAELKGFAAVPWKGGYVAGGAYSYLGGFGMAVSKNCKYPDAVIRLYDYAASFDGVELLYNGIQGEDWTYVNGKPMFTDPTLNAMKAGVDLWSTRGIGYGGTNFLIPLSGLTKDPRYDSYVDFRNNPDIAALSNNPLDEEYCRHYGVVSVQQVWDEAIARGDIKNQKNSNTLAPILFPSTPTNITRIDTNLTQLAVADWGPKMVFARNDVEFNSLKAQALAAFKEAGLAEYTKWLTDSWNTAKARAVSMGL
jgi:hypothetical protein